MKNFTMKLDETEMKNVTKSKQAKNNKAKVKTKKCRTNYKKFLLLLVFLIFQTVFFR